MERKFVLRGLASGALAGLLAFVFARIFAEPVIGRAIDYETARDTAQTALARAAGRLAPPSAPALFSRTVQEDIGIAVALVVFGAALGALLAVVFTLVQRGSGHHLRPRALALLLAAAAFVSVYLVPFLKYPATPPAVGDPDTISSRTGLYFAYLLISVVAAVVATVVAQRVWSRVGTYAAVLSGAGTYLVVVIVAALAMPTVNELGDFPADTLWYFRESSLMTVAALWATIGVVLTGLVGRLHRQQAQETSRRELAAAL